MTNEKKDKEYPKLFSEEFNLSARLSDQIYDFLKNAIISWKIQPGEKLLQEKLASDFGVSQMTIREALSRLTADGLATQEPYKGTRVVSFSPDDLIDIFEVRYQLEGYAMELAASKISKEGIRQMRELVPLSVMDVDDFPNSVDKARESNHKLHWIAINSTGRSFLCNHLRLVWAKIDPYLIYNPWLHSKLSKEELIKDIQYDRDTHEFIINALEAGDGKKARCITEEMISYSLESYRSLLVLASED